MSITKLQDAPITIGTPVEIEAACNQLRLLLAGLSWVDYPYFIAQRFYRKEGQRAFFYPETYAVDANTPEGKYDYHRLTPDNDYEGMFFFYVGDGTLVNYEKYQYNFIQYPVAIIFSVNLQKIDPVKLELGLFTQELISEARGVLTRGIAGLNFQIQIVRESRDLRTVYREFVLDEIEQYNRAPIQCFRFDLLVTIQEVCVP